MIRPPPDITLPGMPRPVRSQTEGTTVRWTHEQIRAARAAELAPLLEKRGLLLRNRGGGNFELQEYCGLVLKASYWRWPEHHLSGNTIDFFTKVLKLSFSDTMREISGPP